mgnify:CR=1 FL=1
MKKLLVAVLALTTASAFAGNMNMIKLDGCFDGTCDTLDFDMNSDDVDGSEAEDMTIAFNYARSFGKFGAGLTYVNKKNTKDGDVQAVGDKSNTIGLSGYYNMHGQWDDSCFVGLHYSMTDNSDTDATTDSGNKVTTISLEYGHRFTIGAIKGHTFSWVPSVTYNMATQAPNGSGDDVKTTTLSLNMANVALTF